MILHLHIYKESFLIQNNIFLTLEGSYPILETVEK